jgi:tetratricopeptide (TPR) repeat protein
MLGVKPSYVLVKGDREVEMSEKPSSRRSGPGAFVGREPELGELDAGLEDARSGRGRFFLVTGEPGIGKSRLADELAAHAASLGMLVLRAGSSEGGGTPAYWSFIQLIRAALSCGDRDTLLELMRTEYAPHAIQDVAQLVPELCHWVAAPTELSPPPSPDLEQARFRLFDSVATALKSLASLKPLMLVVEDLHDADQASLLMLRFVVRQLKDAPVLVLATYRNVEVQRSSTLSQLIGDLTREGSEVPLFALSQADTARMIEERAGVPVRPRLVADIYQATAGNPLFINGLVRVLAAEGRLRNANRLNLAAFRVPDGMREVIRRGLALLSDRAALVTAATIGQQFELRCLQRVSELPTPQLRDVLREASVAGVVTPLSDDGSYTFPQALIRNALCEELNSTDRARLHLKIGEAQAELYEGDVEAHLAELAHHFRQAGDTHRAIDYSIRAGERARAVFAYEEAIAHWQAALDLTPDRGEDRQRQANLLERTAELLGLTASSSDQQFKCLRQALNLYKELGHTEAVARVQAHITGWLMVRGHTGDVSRSLQDDSKTASSERENAEEGTFAVRLHIKAAAAMEALQVEQALDLSRRAMEISEQHGDWVVWAHSALAQANALYASGRLEQSLSLIHRALLVAERLLDGLPGAGLAMLLSSEMFWLRDPAEAVAPLEHELAQPRLTEAALLRDAIFDWLGLVETLRGNLPVNKGRSGLAQRVWLQFEGVIAFYQGEWERADRALTKALNQARQGGKHDPASAYRAWVATVRRTMGQYSAAEMLLKENLAIVTAGPQVILEMHVRQELALIYAETGRPEQAHPHLARCRAIITGGEDWRGLGGHIARAEATVAAAESRFENAQPLFAKAVEIHRRYQVPFDEAETLHYWGRALLAAGECSAALDKLDAATELYRRHGAGERWLERVQTDRLRAQSAVPAAVSAVRETSTFELPEAGTQEKRDEDSGLTGIFRKQGEYWILSWARSESRLKERKGFHYIAWLLRHPGQELAAQDLIANVEPAGLPAASAGAGKPHRGQSATITGSLGDAGPALDATAKAQYKRRLADLGAELELAEQLNDPGRAERTRSEIEFIHAELAAALGLGGRSRKVSSHAERARLAVTKTVKGALTQIRQAHPELGRHLTLSIRTGNFCVYLPEQPVAWKL